MCDIFSICFGGDDEEDDARVERSASPRTRGSAGTKKAPAPVEMSEFCLGCKKGFSITVRRHECSSCNRVYCGDCISRKQESLPWDSPRMCISCEENQQKSFKDDSRIRQFEEDYASYLKTGVIFKKHGTKGFPHRRSVRVNEQYSKIIWSDPTAEEAPRDMDLSDSKIVRGKSTAVMRKTGKSVREECCFSIVGTQRTLDLEADSEVQRDRFIAAMEECLWVSTAIQKSTEAQKRIKQAEEEKRLREKLAIEEEAKMRVDQRRRERDEKRQQTVAKIAQKYQGGAGTSDSGRITRSDSSSSNRSSTETSSVSASEGRRSFFGSKVETNVL